MKRILLLLLILPFMSRAQVINPVPDMVFKGQLSAGRSTGTDSSAYMSIGPARGATKGFMAPMVSDTNAVYQPRRDGLLIFSLQRRNFLYWDSLAVRWREFASGGFVDTLTISTRAWRQKGIDSVRSLPRVTFVASGLGMKFDTIKTSGSVSVDTVVMSTRVRVQKPVDSLGSVKQDKLTLTTIGTTGPSTLVGSVLNIPNYSPGSGFIRNLAPIGSAPNANGMSKFGDTLRLQPASVNFGGVVTIGNQTFAGEKVFDEKVRIGSSGGAVIQKTNQSSVAVGDGALTSSLNIVGFNTAVGQNAGRNNTAGDQNVFVGVSAGDLKSNGQANTRSSNSVFVGMDSRPLGDTQTNQIVIGYQSRGNGSNTTTLGNASTERTFVRGKLNVSQIDSVSSSNNLLISSWTGDVQRIGRVGTSLIDTGTISTKAWRQKGIDSLSASKQNNISLTTTGNSGPSTLSGSTLNVPNYTLAGLGGVPTTRVLSINGVEYDLSADRVWNISGGSGGGTVTSVAAGTGMNFSTITTAGIVNADTTSLSTRAWRQKGIDSVVNLISNAGGGTVMSVSAGTGMSFTTITTNGSVSADTSVLSTRARVKKSIDSLGVVKQNKLTLTTANSSGASTLSNDTLNVPTYTLSGLGGVPTTRTLSINGTEYDLSSNRSWTISTGGSGTITSVSSGYGTSFSTITSTGSVVVDSVVIASRARVQKAIDSLSAVKQNLLSLTTTGNSGASTLIGSTLNVPTYTLSGLGGVPVSRTITINGNSQDLSSNRVWTVPAVTSVAAGVGMSFPTITSSGTVNADTLSISTRPWRQKGVDSLQANINQKVNISDTSSMLSTYVKDAGIGLTKSGKRFDADTIRLSTRAWRQKGIDSVVNLISNAGGGTVLSVSAGTGMIFPTITSTGSVSADTNVLGTKQWRQKGVDSLQANINLKVNIADTSTMLIPYVRSTGTNTYIPKFSPNNRNLVNSAMYDSSGQIRINRSHIGDGNPNNIAMRVNVDGLQGYASITQQNDSSQTGVQLPMVVQKNMLGSNKPRPGFGVGYAMQLPDDAGEFKQASSIVAQITDSTAANFSTSVRFRIRRNNQLYNSMFLLPDSNVRITKLIGTGTRNVAADANGNLVISDIPVDSLVYSTRSWRQKGIDSVVNLISSAGGGTVLSVSAGTGMNFSTITSTGSVNADTSVLGTKAWRQKSVDSLQANINLKVNISDTSTMLTPYVRSTGTNNSLPKFNPNSRNLVNSLISDNGRVVTIAHAGSDIDPVGASFRVNFADAIINSMYVGRGWSSQGSTNTIVGFQSQNLSESNFSASGSGNTSLGFNTLNGSIGSNNTAIGRSSIQSNSGGSSNTAVGASALQFNGNGSNNVSIGANSSAFSNGTNFTVAIGSESANSTNSGGSLSKYDSSVFIGYDTRSPSSNLGNQIVIGAFGRGNGRNTTTIGNSGTQTTFLLGRLDIGSIDSTSSAMNMLYADQNGVVKKAAVPSGGGGSGTVTSVSSGIGMNFSTITSSGVVNADTSVLGTVLWRQKGIDSLGIVKQNVLTLTTTGNSGSSTLIGSTLNIPQYTLSGLGGVPTTRTLTINGVTYDLSADRSWTIPGGGGGGSGTVTAVNSGYGLLGGPIITSGTLLVDTNLISTRAWRQKGFDSLSNLITPTTTIYTGNGTLGSNRTITSGGYTLTFRGDQNFIKMNNAGTARSELATDGLYGIGTPMNVFAPSSQPLIFSSGGSEAGRFHPSRNFTIGGGSSDVGDKLFVNGRVRIATIDSTTNANNILYADENGVIKKSKVPTSAVDMDSTSLTIASGWNFSRDITWQGPIMEIVRTSEGDIKTITIQTVVHKTTATFSTGQWVTVATVPMGYRPNHSVIGSLPNFVSGTGYENQSGNDFADDAYYEGACVFRITTQGEVQVRVDTIGASATLSGANYVIFPIHITYIIKYIAI